MNFHFKIFGYGEWGSKSLPKKRAFSDAAPKRPFPEKKKQAPASEHFTGQRHSNNNKRWRNLATSRAETRKVKVLKALCWQVDEALHSS